MIYILEDDDNIRELVSYTLGREGLPAEGFAHPAAFWEAMALKTPSLLLLDIMLPAEDGISILKKLRADPVTRSLPIILLTAKTTEYDTVLGLDSGADDYIAKPFRMMELLSRVRALLRRTTAPVEDTLTLGTLTVCPARHLVQVDGQTVTLTLKEFDLLCLLLSRPGIVFRREALLEQIWGYGCEIESRTLDVHIRTLRQKLGAASDLIETVRGIGYKAVGRP